MATNRDITPKTDKSRLTFNQPKPFLAAANEQVPECAAAEDASGLLEREKWDKDYTENGGVGQEARQRATEVGETCRDGLTLEPGPDRSLNDVKRDEQDREDQRLAEHDP